MVSDLTDLTESIYDAALSPAGWGPVMRQMRSVFRTTAETFYLLDPVTASMRSVQIDGIAPCWLGNFDAAYFSSDNPWVGLSSHLHQPGVVRTNERLAEYTRDPDVLYRSQYYNEWMRPQAFRYTIGNTLLREARLIANVTLLRPPDMPTFDAAEVRAFEQLSRHMTRAVRFGLQFEAVQGPQQRATQALDLLPHAVLLVDATGTLVHANAAAEHLLRHDGGLVLRAGRVMAARATDQPALDALLRRCGPPSLATASGAGTGDGPDTVVVHPRGGNAGASEHAPLTLSAMPLPEGHAGYRPLQRTILLLAVVADTVGAAPAQLLQRLYHLTPAETRLARELAVGDGLRAAAGRAGIGYGTARTYLKLLFHKTGTHRQADLVRCLLRQVAPALKADA